MDYILKSKVINSKYITGTYLRSTGQVPTVWISGADKEMNYVDRWLQNNKFYMYLYRTSNN